MGCCGWASAAGAPVAALSSSACMLFLLPVLLLVKIILISSHCSILSIPSHVFCQYTSELSTGRMDPRVGLGRVRSRFLPDFGGSGQHFGFLDYFNGRVQEK